MSLNGPSDLLTWRLNERCCVWGQADHFDAFSIELPVFWVAREIVQDKRTLKGSRLWVKVLSDFRDKASVELILEKCFCCLGLLVEQLKDRQMQFIFYLHVLGH